MVTIPPLVVRIRASSTVFVKASSLVNLDFAGMFYLIARLWNSRLVRGDVGGQRGPIDSLGTRRGAASKSEAQQMESKSKTSLGSIVLKESQNTMAMHLEKVITKVWHQCRK